MYMYYFSNKKGHNVLYWEEILYYFILENVEYVLYCSKPPDTIKLEVGCGTPGMEGSPQLMLDIR